MSISDDVGFKIGMNASFKFFKIWYPSFNISFEINPSDYTEVSGWILHLLADNDRFLRIFFIKNGTSLHVRNNKYQLTYDKISLHVWTKIAIGQYYNGTNYLMNLIVNQTEQIKIINSEDYFVRRNVSVIISKPISNLNATAAVARMRYLSVESFSTPSSGSSGAFSISEEQYDQQNNILVQVLEGNFPTQSCNVSQPEIVIDTDSGELKYEIVNRDINSSTCNERCATCFDDTDIILKIKPTENWSGRIYDSSNQGMFYCYECECKHSCLIGTTTTIAVGVENSSADVSCLNPICILKYFTNTCEGFYDGRGSCIEHTQENKKVSFPIAREECENHGSKLITILDAEYNEMVLEII